VTGSVSYDVNHILILIYDKANVEIFNDESSLGTDSQTADITNSTLIYARKDQKVRKVNS